MRNWLRRILGGTTPTPRFGVPAVRRLKSHTAASGYVYQYYFEGYVESASKPGEPTSAREYEFLLAPNRKDERRISLILPREVRNQLEQTTGRALTNSECYAVAKLSLFTLLDEADSPTDVPNTHVIVKESAREISDLLEF